MQDLVMWGIPIGVGVVVWLVRMEGRINGAEAVAKSLREDIQYIRDRIDRALNGHG